MDALLREFVDQVRVCITATKAVAENPSRSGDAINFPRYASEISKFEASATFLGLTRLARLTAGACVAAKANPSSEGVRSVLCEILSRISDLLEQLEQHQREPEGDDDPLLSKLENLVIKANVELPVAGQFEPSLSAAGSDDAGTGQIVSVPIEKIEVGSRLRQLKPAKVEQLAQSIEEIGLRTPITVVIHAENDVELVCGLHRLAAVKSLGKDQIDCLALDETALEREIWEIDENLMRCDLTQLERDVHLARRKKIFDARHIAETGRNAPSFGGRGNKGFAADTEARAGLPKRRVNESIKRVRRISSRVQDAIRDLPAANLAVELDALADLDETEQLKAVAQVKEGHAANFRDARDKIRGNADAYKTAAHVRKLKTVWLAANPDARSMFMKWLNESGDRQSDAKDVPSYSRIDRGAA